MEEKFEDIRNELQDVKQQIAKKEAALERTEEKIEAAEEKLEQATDAETARRLDEKLESLRKDKEALNAQLVKLQGQAEKLQGQREAMAQQLQGPGIVQEVTKLAKRVGEVEEVVQRKLQRTSSATTMYTETSDQELAAWLRKNTERLPVRFEPDNKAVMMSLTDQQLEESRKHLQHGTLPQGPYHLGRCKLPSELYLVQPLAVNMLTELAKDLGDYRVYDTHNTPLHVLDGDKIDVVVVYDPCTKDAVVPDDAAEAEEPAEVPMMLAAADAPGAAQGDDSLAVHNDPSAEPAASSHDDPRLTSASRPKRQTTLGITYSGLDDDSAGDADDSSYNADSDDLSYELDSDAFKEEEPSSVPDDFAGMDTSSSTAITATNTALLVELKKHGSVMEEKSAVQIIRYMRSFLKSAPLRDSVTAVLTDLQSAEVYTMTRDPDHQGRFSPACHGVFTGNEIYPMLKALLSHPNDVLDCKPLLHNGQQVQFVRRLGRGAFGRVRHVKIGDEEFAMKFPYKPDEHIQREHDVLQQIAGMANVPATCQLISLDGRTYLLTQPVGVPCGNFAWTRKLALGLLEGIQQVHRTHRIVHRDVRPSNIVWDSERDQLILIDWACAVRVEDCAAGVSYCGSRAYKAHRLFGQVDLFNYAPSLIDDLGSLLLVIAAAFSHLPNGKIERADLTRFARNDKTVDWWAAWSRLLPPAWLSTYQALDNLTYDEAVQRLTALCRSLPEGRLQ